ncbi:response regulator [Chryseobacterium sp.]|uniref:response regulator n=1 Tax=Chryseobacterium sp. TaxID=1871047 RepID=UPI00388F67EF
MFRKVLIAEDNESANISVQKVLEELKIEQVDHVYYCDDAVAKIKKSQRENEPYDLLITDLSFEEDHYTQLIKGGKDLVEQVKKLQENLKIIVFSSENKTGIIDALFSDYHIDGYVRKGRYDSQELKEAITTVYEDGKHLADPVKKAVKKMNAYEISSHDIDIVTVTAKGIILKEIPDNFKSRGIEPNSLSTIEKRLSQLKNSLWVKTNEHLIAYCKDLGII